MIPLGSPISDQALDGPMSSQVSVITVNFKTPLLVKDCIETFLSLYPEIPYIVVDNGGCDLSLTTLRSLAATHSNLILIENPKNVGHGPALHRGVTLADTPYAFTLDSDTRTEKGGFLELMLDEFTTDESLFVIGWLRRVNRNGVAFRTQDTGLGDPYIHPYASLLDMRKYHSLRKGFVHSGSPAIYLMQDAVSKGYHLASFPIEDYIWHKESGTRGLFGGKIRVATDTPVGNWNQRRL